MKNNLEINLNEKKNLEKNVKQKKINIKDTLSLKEVNCNDHFELNIACPTCRRSQITINSRKTKIKVFENVVQYICKHPVCKKTFYGVGNKYYFENKLYDTVEEYCEVRRKFAVYAFLSLINKMEASLYDLNHHLPNSKDQHFELLDVVKQLYNNQEKYEKIDKKFKIKFNE